MSLNEGGGYCCGTLEVPAGDGVKNITVAARDALGNERTASASATIQRYIKGPDIGEGCNNNDNIFNSLTVSPADPNVIYVGSEGNGIFKSTDGISTYSCVLDAEKNIEGIAISPTDPDIIYVGTTGLIIYKSVDGGNTFTLMKDLRSFIDSY